MDEENALSLSNVTGKDNGTYKCVARGYFDLTSVISIEIKVRPNFAPIVRSFSSSPPKAVLGKSVTITCEASARPEPTYTIIHNGTIYVSIEKTTKNYTIPVVEHSDAGSYECIAKNKFGHSSSTFHLIVIDIGPVQLTTIPTANSSSKGSVTTTKSSNQVECGSVVVWHVVVAMLSGIVIGALLSCVVVTLYFRRRFKVKKSAQSNPERPTSSKVDSIYQDLDLSRMNQEENYQTLQGAVNSGSTENESNYTELNLVRGVEDNYESLTST